MIYVICYNIWYYDIIFSLLLRERFNSSIHYWWSAPLNIISPRWGYKNSKVASQHQSLSFQANKKNHLKWTLKFLSSFSFPSVKPDTATDVCEPWNRSQLENQPQKHLNAGLSNRTSPLVSACILRSSSVNVLWRPSRRPTK